MPINNSSLAIWASLISVKLKSVSTLGEKRRGLSDCYLGLGRHSSPSVIPWAPHSPRSPGKDIGSIDYLFALVNCIERHLASCCAICLTLPRISALKRLCLISFLPSISTGSSLQSPNPLEGRRGQKLQCCPLADFRAGKDMPLFSLLSEL